MVTICRNVEKVALKISRRFGFCILLLLLFLIFLFFTEVQIWISGTQIMTMKIHPATVSGKRSVSMRERFGSSSFNSSKKKLRKLPHVFSKVLELPFRADADVEIEDSPEKIRFIADVKVENGVNYNDVVGMRAHTIEIHPGVTKVVVRSNNNHNNNNSEGVGSSTEVVELLLDDLNMDTWRFRLPRSSLPELATASFLDGELIVTVPKAAGAGNNQIESDDVIWRSTSNNNLVLVL